MAVPHFRRKQRRNIVIGDNLGSHLSYNVLKFCEENEISFVLLPPNSTHLCQPLDVAVFRAIKAQWRKVLMQWKEKNVGCVPKTEFPRLLRETIQSVKSSENVIAGFKVCGIIPLNSRKVLDKLIPKGPPTVADEQCPDEIVPDKSTSTTLRNTPLTYKHDSAGSFSITRIQLNRVYVRARDYAKLYWSTCSVLFRPNTADEALQGSFAEIMGTVAHLNQVKRVNRKWIN
jgi:hypothetical protein